MRGNPFTLKARRDAFDDSVKALRKMFPNAKDSFIRGQARANARRVLVAKKARAPRERVFVAQTYRAPTRAERTEAHGNKVLRKAGERLRLYNARRASKYPVKPLANLSRNHPDYGCTPAEHAKRKAGRLV